MGFTDKELIDLHPSLLLVAYRACNHNTEDAKDLVQDTMLMALRKRDKFIDQGKDSLIKWLYRMMRNIQVNGFRHDSLYIQHQATPLSYYYDTSKEGYIPISCSNQHADDIVNEDDVWGVINQMSKKRRGVLKLWIKGYTFSEIPVMMGMPPGTMRSNIFQARNYVSKALGLQRPILRKD